MQKSNTFCRALLAALLLGGSLVAAAPAAAQDAGLEVRDASTRLEDGVWYLSARVYYGLNRETLEALQSGIILTFAVEAQVLRYRRWLPNAEVVTLRQDFELAWQPLSRVYTVRDQKSGEQRAHTTLYAALNDLGRIEALPLVDAALLDPGSRHEVGLRALLDQQKLPGALRLLAFWDDDYALESEWYWWPLGN